MGLLKEFIGLFVNNEAPEDVKMMNAYFDHPSSFRYENGVFEVAENYGLKEFKENSEKISKMIDKK